MAHTPTLTETLNRLAAVIAHSQAINSGTHICTDDCPALRQIERDEK